MIVTKPYIKPRNVMNDELEAVIKGENFVMFIKGQRIQWAWSCRKNATHRNSKTDVRKAVCNKTKRKTKNEMAG